MNRSPRAVVLLTALVAGLFSGCEREKETTSPSEPEARTVGVISALPNFSLTDRTGASFGAEQLHGKVWIADFIFTRCPGTCPLQTTEKVKLAEELTAKDLRFVSFTVDPEFDTASVLSTYAENQGAEGARWKFLTGSRGDLWNLSANGFKFDVADDAKNKEMPILHSSHFALVDRLGRLRGTYDGLTEEGRKELLADLEVVLAEPAPPAKPSGTYEKFPHPKEIMAPPWLKSRQQLQELSASGIDAFHDFKLNDTVETSGITFQNRIVDDAGKLYKAVHYDHGNGIAVADVDSDGLYDLYFTTQIGGNELWRNLGNGKFRNITTPGIALADKIGVTASFADTDNDGDPDLFVTTVRGGNHFFENDGTGTFVDRTEAMGLGYVGHSSGAVFFDYDKDGWLDLFLCNVGVYTTDERGAGGYCIGLSDAFEGHTKPKERNERSILYRNEGGERFVDASEESGLVDESWTGDAAPFDYNNDGWVDLYVLSMQGHDELYENVQGKFVKKSREVFPKTPWGSMGVQIFDFDNDGRQDLFITDMHSDMSEEVGPNREKAKSDMKWDEEMLQSGGQSIFGNAFFRSTKVGAFEEVSDELGAENYWPWGLSAGDLNADGFVDVFIAASMNYPFRYGVNSLLLNDRGKKFADSEFILGVEPRRGGRTAKPWFTLDPTGEDKEHGLVSEFNLTEPVEVWGSLGTRASVIFDFDNDGDLDIVTNEFHDGPMVLRSNLSEKKAINWLKVALTGKEGSSNRDGLGAVVSVTAGGKSYTQVHDGVSGYLSHSILPLYFGLGEAGKVERVTIKWPSGAEQVVSEPPVNAVVKVVEE